MGHSVKAHDDRLADFRVDGRVILLSAMAAAVGALGALAAWALVSLIAVITNLAYFQRLSTASVSPAGHHLGLAAVLVPTAGGLIVGLMARFGSERIRGHGIPEALEAILIGESRMQAKVAALKPLSSAVAIGTGGPFGAEGPIIMTGGALGSLFAQLFDLSSAKRRTLLAAGAAAGMSAIFASPLAAVLLAVELLLFEWRPRSFIPVALASVVASALRVPLLGQGPIFPIPPHAPLGGAALVAATVVGLIAGLGSGIATTLVYTFEDLFRRLPIHWMWWPAIGGLAIGLGGLVEPRVLGVGYDVIHGLLRGDLVAAGLLGLLVAKALVWSIGLGSGTSGGVLAPLLILGGCLGALEARWIPFGDPGLWAAISMAALMGGTLRSPFAAMIFAVEVTHDVNLIPGLLVGCIASDLVTVFLLRRSILTEKVARRGYHIAYEYSVDPLQALRVGEVMDTDVPTLPASMTVGELSDRIALGDPQLAARQGTPIVDRQGRLVGIITRGDVLEAIRQDPSGQTPVLDAGRPDLIVTYPDELLLDAVTRMLEHEVGRLPVVSREDPRNLVGYLGRTGVLEARLRRMQEESRHTHGLSLRALGLRPGASHTASR